MNEVVNPLNGITVSYCLFLWIPLTIFQGLTASQISQSGSFALPAVMGGTGIA